MIRNTYKTIYQTTAVAFFAAAFFCIATTIVSAASLSLSPSTGVYQAGQTFTTRILVNTNGAAINAAEATLSFNPAQLSVVSVSRGGTFSLWAVEPSFSNTAGTITFGGGSPAGYTGSNGTVLTVTWRSKGAGTARVTFANGSVLAADGRGTNVVQNLNGGVYTIAAADVAPEPEVIEYIAPANTPGVPVIESATHQSDNWSTSTTATLTWSLPNDVVAVRTLLDENSGSIPTRVYDEPISEITLPDLEEGIQYFHLQFRNESGWGRVAHYRLAVDLTAPESFTISLPADADSTQSAQVLLLDAKDSVSPISRFLVQLNGAEPFEYIDSEATGSIQLPVLSPGYHTVVIEAFDSAGNSRVATFSFTIDSFEAPIFTEVPNRVNAGVIPVLRGSSKPGASVEVSIAPVSNSQQPITYTVTADETGLFTVIPDSGFSEGVYELTAKATDTQGAQSAVSEPVRMIVALPGYLQFGSYALSVLSVIVPLLALVIVCVLLVWYFIVRSRRIRRFVVAETDEAIAVLESEFSNLRSIVAEEKTNLAGSRKTKKLTKAETMMTDRLTQALRDAETSIKIEISDVDDMVE